MLKDLKKEDKVYQKVVVGKDILKESETDKGMKFIVVEVSDESGSMECTMWGDECIKRTKENLGKEIKVNKFFINEFESKLTMTSGKWGWITKNAN